MGEPTGDRQRVDRGLFYDSSQQGRHLNTAAFGTHSITGTFGFIMVDRDAFSTCGSASMAQTHWGSTYVNVTHVEVDGQMGTAADGGIVIGQIDTVQGGTTLFNQWGEIFFVPSPATDKEQTLVAVDFHGPFNQKYMCYGGINYQKDKSDDDELKPGSSIPACSLNGTTQVGTGDIAMIAYVTGDPINELYVRVHYYVE